MNVFLYTSELCAAGQDLRSMLQQELAAQQLALFSNITDMASFLGLAMKNNDIVLAVIDTPEELKELLTIRFLLEDVRLIILMAMENEEDIAIAHRLRPRFLSTLESDLQQVTAVLHRMMAQEIAQQISDPFSSQPGPEAKETANLTRENSI